ncbi:mini-chromosome maintenance complex-binding protein-like [Homalodisca vitripennis]|uniref:mini-chromosome maintenance complex-binding protein-like n=1 Tax=Homalodisca vitripennis TaxID=197043 RepID=UPI001EECE23E|nr:mini-chromosome maintenance complex-binding protein-like [Homalodisca vitripennis]
MESWTSSYWQENSKVCMDEFKKDDSWEKVPLINTTPHHLLKDGQLVRFRGMIQDMYNPVYYLATYEVLDTTTNQKIVRSGKYKDSLQCAEHEKVLFESDLTVNQERRPVYCISVPAVNDWAKCKKTDPRPDQIQGPRCAAGGVKRNVEDTNDTPDESPKVGSNEEQSKRLCSSRSETAVVGGTGMAMDTSSVEQTMDLNLPIPDSQAEACLINFYDVEEGQLQINAVIEVAGFLSYDVALVTSAVDGLDEPLPPPSLVPRLHAVAQRPVHFSNPLLTSQITVDEVVANVPRLRDELKLVLTQLLLGDALAADYLICHLISRIYLRQDMLVLGKFSLNLSNIPDRSTAADYTFRLYQLLQTLLSKSHYLPITLDNMNNINMIPKKNYETNRLESGLLQLSDKTHLVIDETMLEPGQLNDRGVRNCRALGSVISNQRLEYDFQFYPVEFNTDIPVLILSEGKSMLPSDCHLPLEVDAACLATVRETFAAATHYLREPLLSQLRVYLSLVSTADYDLTPEVQQIVQEDFVKMRQEQAKTSAQDLHSLLVLAKLLSLSQGARCLTKECWEMARQMESKRKARIR